MATAATPETTALDALRQIDMLHGKAPLTPAHSLPVAEALVSRFQTIGKPVPLAILRFMDRAKGPQPGPAKDDFVRNKLARDLHGVSDFGSLSPANQSHVMSVEIEIRNPATGHPYQRAGFDFAQARHVLMDAYKLLGKALSYPPDVRAKIGDFVNALEMDIVASAKRNGFYDQYSKRLNALRESIISRDKISTAVRK